jgi:hypothetical protein
MPNYACLRGDCEGIALTEEDCFVLRDDRGRDWLCFDESDRGDTLDPMWSAQIKLGKLGLASKGTQLACIECDSVDQLKLELGQREDMAFPAE